MARETTDLQTLRASLIELLAQGSALCETVSDQCYVTAPRQVAASPIGGHYRHCLEHFRAILDRAPGDGPVDYDARGRERRLETDRGYAMRQTRRLAERARTLDLAALDHPVRVRCSVSTDPASPVVGSSLAREVMYAIIHAVHHYAIIRILCSLQGIELSPAFGVAPSTLNHLRASSGA